MNKEKISPWKGTLAVAGIGLALAACEDKEVAPLTLAETSTVSPPLTFEMPTPTFTPAVEVAPSLTQNPTATPEPTPTETATLSVPTPEASSPKTEAALNYERLRSLTEVYLRDARANIVSVNGRRAIIPSRVYANGIYARDAFFASVGLADAGVSAESFRFFEENINQVSGQIPSAVPFNPEESSLVPQDDESSLLYIVWAGILARDGVSFDRGRLEQAYRFAQSHIKEGYYVSPAGPFRYWADTVSPERPERIAYNQGFYAVSLRMLKELGVGNISDEQIEQAKTSYRSFYNPALGYLTLGRDSYFANAQDVSALLPEFFSRYLFAEPMLSDEVVLATVNHHLDSASVRFADGRLAGIKVISSPGGGFYPPERFFVPQQNQPGNYQNGGYWPMYTLVELSLAYRIRPEPRYLEAINQLLEAELARDPNSKEYLMLTPGQVGDFDPNRSVYSWNALAYRALAWSGLI